VVWRRRDEATAEADGYAAEKRLFRFSLGYLFLHFGR
jgi:protoheme IX farnesyltransferase